MNPEWADQPQPQSGGTGKPGTPGEQMQAQREALGWSVEQAAEQLKLAPRQVAAIESGDYAALPNPAVARGFIRAYAKILKLDAAPLVAAIAITPADNAEVMPARALSASFSESRFPSLTQRSSNTTGWIAGAVAVLVLAGAGAYKMGYISPARFLHGDQASASVAAESKPAGAAADTAPAAADAAVAPAPAASTEAPTQSTSVPLISVPSGGADAAAPAAPSPAPAVATPAPAVAAPAPATVAAPDAPAAGAKAEASPLVLTVRQDSWIEIRRKSGAPLISRIVLAGSTETFDISEPVLLVVGKPGGVDATLRGAALELHPIPGGTTARLNLK